MFRWAVSTLLKLTWLVRCLLAGLVALDDILRVVLRRGYLVALDVGLGYLLFDDLAVSLALARVPLDLVACFQVFAIVDLLVFLISF